RGLLEPSLALHGGRYFITVRAEDQHGYVASSADGLDWSRMKAWAWDDGEVLTMSTTQQHWLPHRDGLFLTYTRKDAANVNVMRWRTPIYVARVDPERLCLIRASEKVVFPLVGDGVNDPKNVPMHGNFHTTAISPTESLVTSCDLLARDFTGDTMLARIRWSRPNRDITE
ncbi:MAG: exo-alpha-sialidase, partial [Acidobacteria bacterium]|nr:exo-alpha-sialidase [Acidobacteriota bacterium]